MTTLGELCDVSRTKLEELRAEEGDTWRQQAEVLTLTREAYISEKGKKAGAAAFKKWAIDTLHYSEPVLSRMRTVVSELEEIELRTLPNSMQYAAAQALKSGADHEAVIADADVLSVSDFKANHLPGKEGKESVKVPCPKCGSKVDPKRLEE